MYLNEKSWEIPPANAYVAAGALNDFLKLYARVKRQYPFVDMYIPNGMEMYFHHSSYSLAEWMAKADIEYKRLFLTLKDKAIYYEPESEYEVISQNEILLGGTQACLHDSCMVSICFDQTWKKEECAGLLYCLHQEEAEQVTIKNIYTFEQVFDETFKQQLEKDAVIQVYAYEDIWKRRAELFPHLSFCPSVKKNLMELQPAYLHQVVRKLEELEAYCKKHGHERFQPACLSKTTMESKPTMQKYAKEHTFYLADKTAFTATWHMRFTGDIAGRIFFIPEYQGNGILVCYIGGKLPTVTYAT